MNRPLVESCTSNAARSVWVSETLEVENDTGLLLLKGRNSRCLTMQGCRFDINPCSWEVSFQNESNFRGFKAVAMKSTNTRTFAGKFRPPG